jgi:phosphatidylglycerophosphate synthase
VTTSTAVRLRLLAAAAAAPIVVSGILGFVRAIQPIPRLHLHVGPPHLAALAAYAAITTVAAVQLPRHHPHRRLGAANVVTVVRACLASIAAGQLLAPPTRGLAWLVVGLATTLAILDGVDGALARRSGLASAFGARFDLEVDAFFILVLSAHVWHHGKAGAWVLACGLMRYAFVAAARPLPWLAGPLAPTWRGRAVAVLQFVGLAVALAPIVPSPLSDAVAAVSLSALAWSFAADVRRLHRQRTDR